MAAFTGSVEIERPVEEVFAYLDDLARHGEWQEQIVSVRVETPGPTRVGTRAAEVRRVGGRQQRMIYEITEHSPPRVFAFRGLGGPLRPVGRGTVEAAGEGSSVVTVDFDFEVRGLVGRLLLPLARRQARKQIRKDQLRLKARLETDV